MKPAISSADLVRAFDLLKRPNKTNRRIIAELLGFEMQGLMAFADDTVDKPTMDQPRPMPRQRSVPLPKPPLRSSPGPAKTLATQTSITVMGPEKRDTASMPWSEAAGDFAVPQGPRVPIAVASLFEPRWTRSILSTALGGRGATGPVNMLELVNSIAEGRPVRSLPRLPGGLIAPRVDVLLDVGESMMPFADDQVATVAAVRTVIGAEAVRPLKFRGSPLRGAGTDKDEIWPKYFFPGLGTRVLLLTDFGIGCPPTGTTVAGADEWRLFANALRKRQISCTAFVPYPAARWPAEVKRMFTMVQWDRATTAGKVKSSLGPLLR